MPNVTFVTGQFGGGMRGSLHFERVNRIALPAIPRWATRCSPFSQPQGGWGWPTAADAYVVDFDDLEILELDSPKPQPTPGRLADGPRIPEPRTHYAIEVGSGQAPGPVSATPRVGIGCLASPSWAPNFVSADFPLVGGGDTARLGVAGTASEIPRPPNILLNQQNPRKPIVHHTSGEFGKTLLGRPVRDGKLFFFPVRTAP